MVIRRRAIAVAMGACDRRIPIAELAASASDHHARHERRINDAAPHRRVASMALVHAAPASDAEQVQAHVVLALDAEPVMPHASAVVRAAWAAAHVVQASDSV